MDEQATKEENPTLRLTGDIISPAEHNSVGLRLLREKA